MTERIDRSMGAELESSVSARLQSWTDARVAARLWQKDGTLWAASGKQPADLAAWLGWLDLPTAMQARVPELDHLADAVRADGYTRAAVLGMGGSSLAPELFSRVFGFAGGAAAPDGDGLELRILDSTHPDAVRGFREWATAARTIFCVSSKSGTTTEPNAFHAAMAAEAPALDFIAITDPGTALADLARTQEFRAIVDAPPDVGGRYSALTVFGLVPAMLHGVPIGALLERAATMAERCQADPVDNPGLRLGAYIGEAALAGRDKLTVLTSSRLASFGDWVEQLIAESTGKQGTGIVPIVGEPIGEPERYGDDRCFVVLTLADDPDTEWRRFSEALTARGHPLLHIVVGEPLDVGGEFVRWEVATAAAGIVLGIDPFDQPNVQESKDATKELLAAARNTGRLSTPAPLVATEGMALYGDPKSLGDTPLTVDGGIRQLLSLARPGDYFALLAYLPQDRDVEALLQRLRAQVRDALGIATTLGFGPRFLHSTGQLHKGGPDSGIYLQITAEPRKDLPIPGWDETFGMLIAAQALGDLQSLQRRNRRVLRLHFADAGDGWPKLEAMVAEALSGLVAA
ncbi:MAG TPA: glucose-6-phosphate isomerase [Candidatus Limnocylindria bacterium]|nr:glucose-6-phosphate isomerase [Candidatus Limnocylindria bacterium]